VDQDTFVLESGNPLEMHKLQKIVAATELQGWSQIDGNQNRYFLINDMLSGSFSVQHSIIILV
jgi:hypothetical protein